MALPNLLNATAIYGRTAFANVTTVSSNVLVNPSASGNSFRIVNLMAAGIDATNSANIKVLVLRAGVNNLLANAVTVPNGSTLIVLGKENPITLEEGDALQMSADANSRIWATIAYEDIA